MFSTKATHFYIFLFGTVIFFQPLYTAEVDVFGSVESMEEAMTIDQDNNTLPDDSSRGIDMFDDIDSFEQGMDDLDINDFLNTVALDTGGPRNIEPAEILELLEAANVFSVLDQDFYRRTNPFVQRSILDLPLWELHSCTEPKRWIVGAHAFWNHMDRSVFFGKSTNIDTLINFDQTTIFDKLNELKPQIKQLVPNPALVDDLLDQTNINNLLSLFRNFTIQQRRTGAMMHAWRQWERFELRMFLPLYYLERNMFARPTEQAALEERFGALDQDTQEKMQKNFLISDKFGLGDFRFEADYAVYKSDDFTFRVGGLTTIPTAVAFTEGIMGSSFVDTNKKQPTFDLQALFDLIPDNFDVNAFTDADQQKALDIVIGDVCKNKNGFFLGMLSRMSAMLLDTKLGNDGHVGIGVLVRARTLLSSFLYEFEWAKRFSFNNKLSLEYLTPANETRYFVYRNKLSDFTSRDFSSSDPDVQEANLKFIETEMVNKFYPFAVRTKVQPGVIFRWVSRYCWCGDVWDITVGSDFWLQTKEKFNNFRTSQSLERLDIQNGKKPFAYQGKIFASFALKWARPTHTWHVGLNAEGTTWNEGIGEDWTVSLNIEANF